MDSNENATYRNKGKPFSGEAPVSDAGDVRRLSDGHLRLITDIMAVVIGFLLAGRHFIFSSYPLGVAFVAALPGCVWPALLGAALGSLTLGKTGVVYSMICVLVVFLRVVISGVDKSEAREGGDGGNSGGRKRMFSESIPLRMSAAVIGGFVIGVYEILLSGFGLASVMFALSMIIIPALIVPLIAITFGSGVGMRDFLTGRRNIFSASRQDKRAYIKQVFFKISLAVFVFLISFSLERYSFFGIDLGLVFASFATLFAAKRFGWLYGLAAGFISSFGLTGLYSVAFALMGAVAGALFTFGMPYALLGGGGALVLWGAYAGGVTGVLSVIPEYMVAAALSFPLFGYLSPERCGVSEQTASRMATDMVGTMALAHRNKMQSSLSALERSVIGAASAVRSFSSGEDGAIDGFSEALSLLGKIMNEAALCSQGERDMDEELTELLEPIFEECGFQDGIIRAFGERRKHIICAGEDKDGLLITSPELKEKMSRAAGVRLSSGEYFRRGEMVLMECEASAAYKLEGAVAGRAGDGGEVSGDCVKLFTSDDMYSCALIADGMGKGDVARRASEFVCSFISSVLGSGASTASVLSMANYILKQRTEECSVGFDLFSLDLLLGKAVFIKSGAASSYIKRGESLFRISSRTVPIGLLCAVDAEQIRADVEDGDYIIMMSDGISDSQDGAAWLIEELGKPVSKGLSEFASDILAAAVRNNERRDDMSVAVLRVSTVK